jgi:nickel transport protein
MIRHARSLMTLSALGLSMPALAHTVWMVPEQGGWRVLFGGHAGKLQPYPAAKLKQVIALGADGGALTVSRRAGQDGVHLSVAGKPSLILAHYDNGIHTTRSDGPSVEQPMDRVPNAIKATRAVKFHKTIAAWTPIAARPAGQRFEIVPVSPAQPVAGQAMKVRVLIDGKPAPGIAIARNEEGRDAVSDADGVASFTPVRGFNKLWSGRRMAVQGNPAFTEYSLEYSMGFFAR